MKEWEKAQKGYLYDANYDAEISDELKQELEKDGVTIYENACRCGGAVVELKRVHQDFSVCQVKDYSLVNFESQYCFIGKTDEEKSLVCITSEVPSNTIRRDDGWKAFRIQGVLDFSLIGILSKIAVLLADNEISIFAVSTYNTDYVLIKRGNYQRGLEILEAAGYKIVD